MRTIRPELGLERVIAAFERELLDATDQEILETANELGMDPSSKSSAALFGVIFTLRPISAKRLRSAEKNVRLAEPSPRTRTQRSSSSSSGPRPPRRRSKRSTPASD